MKIKRLSVLLILASIFAWGAMPRLASSDEDEDSLNLFELHPAPLQVNSKWRRTILESLNMTTTVLRDNKQEEANTVNENSALAYMDVIEQVNKENKVTSFTRSYSKTMTNRDMETLPQIIQDCGTLHATHEDATWKIAATAEDGQNETQTVELNEKDVAYFQSAFDTLLNEDDYSSFMRSHAPATAVTEGSTWTLPARPLMDALNLDRSVKIDKENSSIKATLNSLKTDTAELWILGRAIGKTTVGEHELDYRMDIVLKDLLHRDTAHRIKLDMTVRFTMYSLRDVLGVSRALTVQGTMHRVITNKHMKEIEEQSK